MCAERGTPSISGSWYDHPNLKVPALSMDMVFHAQGLHHIPRAADAATYHVVFDKLARPVRHGGWLHLSDGSPHMVARYGTQGQWIRHLNSWADAQRARWAVVRNETCGVHQHVMLRRRRL